MEHYPQVLKVDGDYDTDSESNSEFPCKHCNPGLVANDKKTDDHGKSEAVGKSGDGPTANRTIGKLPKLPWITMRMGNPKKVVKARLHIREDEYGEIHIALALERGGKMHMIPILPEEEERPTPPKRSAAR